MRSPQSYSTQNAVRFQWASVSGDLNPERVAHLQHYLCGQEILDAGCGGGAFVEFLCHQGLKVTGVDYHEMFLELARKRPGAVGKYVRGDITALPFPDKSFDCTYCFDVLEHVDDQQALKELLRVTRSRIIISVPASDLDNFDKYMTFYHYQDLTHLRTYTSDSLAQLIRLFGQENFVIVPELPVTIQHLAIQQLSNNSSATSLKAVGRNFYHRLLRRLLSYARYPIVNSGWTAVITLDDDKAASLVTDEPAAR